MESVKGECDICSNEQINTATAAQQIALVNKVPVKWSRLPANPLDPQALAANFSDAVKMKPDLITGLGVSTFSALTRQVETAGIPLIVNDADDEVLTGGKAASKWVYNINTTAQAQANAQVLFALQDLHAKKIGIISTNDQYGATATEYQKALLKSLKITPCAVREYAANATDLTAPVLAMRNCDAIVGASYPNTLPLEMKTYRQNNMNIPRITGITGTTAVLTLSGKELEGLWYSSPCNVTSQDPTMKTMAAAYKAKAGTDPTALDALFYDQVLFAAAVLDNAKSYSRDDILQSIQTTKIKGACIPEIGTDGAHTLSHQMQIIQVKPDKSQTTVKTYKVAALDKSPVTGAQSLGQ